MKFILMFQVIAPLKKRQVHLHQDNVQHTDDNKIKCQCLQPGAYTKVTDNELINTI